MAASEMKNGEAPKKELKDFYSKFKKMSIESVLESLQSRVPSQEMRERRRRCFIATSYSKSSQDKMVVDESKSKCFTLEMKKDQEKDFFKSLWNSLSMETNGEVTRLPSPESAVANKSRNEMHGSVERVTISEGRSLRESDEGSHDETRNGMVNVDAYRDQLPSVDVSGLKVSALREMKDKDKKTADDRDQNENNKRKTCLRDEECDPTTKGADERPKSNERKKTCTGQTDVIVETGRPIPQLEAKIHSDGEAANSNASIPTRLKQNSANSERCQHFDERTCSPTPDAKNHPDDGSPKNTASVPFGSKQKCINFKRGQHLNEIRCSPETNEEIHPVVKLQNSYVLGGKGKTLVPSTYLYTQSSPQYGQSTPITKSNISSTGQRYRKWKQKKPTQKNCFDQYSKLRSRRSTNLHVDLHMEMGITKGGNKYSVTNNTGGPHSSKQKKTGSLSTSKKSVRRTIGQQMTNPDLIQNQIKRKSRDIGKICRPGLSGNELTNRCSSPETSLNIKHQKQMSLDSKFNSSLFCSVCSICVNSKPDMQWHLNGARHCKAMKVIERKFQTEENVSKTSHVMSHRKIGCCPTSKKQKHNRKNATGNVALGKRHQGSHSNIDSSKKDGAVCLKLHIDLRMQVNT